MQEIIGHTITALRTNEDASLLEFVDIEGRRFVYRTEGDCCNQVWFNHINNIDALLGSTVLSIEEKQWQPITEDRDIVGNDEYEELGVWTIATIRGQCDIEVRNNHNGYYGGTIIAADAASDEFGPNIEIDF